jgi:hypothetical protein
VEVGDENKLLGGKGHLQTRSASLLQQSHRIRVHHAFYIFERSRGVLAGAVLFEQPG